MFATQTHPTSEKEDAFLPTRVSSENNKKSFRFSESPKQLSLEFKLMATASLNTTFAYTRQKISPFGVRKGLGGMRPISPCGRKSK